MSQTTKPLDAISLIPDFSRALKGFPQDLCDFCGELKLSK